MAGTLRTLEVVYWFLSLVIGLGVIFTAPWIAENWLHSNHLNSGEITQIIKMMGVVIALRWPSGLYQGALLGMQQHVALNTIIISFVFLNWMGSALVLWLYSPTLQAYFIWQTGVAVLFTISMLSSSWKIIPGSFFRSGASLLRLKEMIPFASGVAGIGILSVLLMQIDKIVLSTLLPLDIFGYYILISMIAGALEIFAGPISKTVFPRFSAMIKEGKSLQEISSLYHQTSKLVFTLIVPATLTIAWYSYELLIVYTGNNDLADKMSAALAVLAISKMFHAGMQIPYTVQLAYGWARLALYQNILTVVFMIPLLFLMVEAWGVVGAALSWLMVTLSYIIVGMPFMHNKILVGELKDWYLKDFGVVIVASVVGVIGLGELLDVSYNNSSIKMVLLLALLYIAGVCAVWVADSFTKKLMAKV